MSEIISRRAEKQLRENPMAVFGNTGECLHFVASVIDALLNKKIVSYSEHGDSHDNPFPPYIEKVHWDYILYPKIWHKHEWYNDPSKKLFPIEIDVEQDLLQVCLNHMVKREFHASSKALIKRKIVAINHKKKFPKIKSIDDITPEIMQFATQLFYEKELERSKKPTDTYDRKSSRKQQTHICRKLFYDKWKSINAEWVTFVQFRDIFANQRKFLVDISNALECTVNQHARDLCEEYLEKNIAMGKKWYPQLNIITGQLTII